MAIFLNALVFMVQLTDLEAKLSVIEANPDHVHWKGFCGVSPVVLGVWVVDEDIDTEIFQHDGLPRPFTVPRQTPHSLQFDHGVFIIIIIRNFNSKGNCQQFSFFLLFLFLFQINTSTELEKQLQSVAIPVRSLRRRSVHVDMQAIDEESASADESGSSTSFLEPASIGDHAENAELPDAPQAAPLLSQSLPLGDQPTIPSPDSTTPSGRKPSIWLLMFMIITFCFRLYSEGVFWLVAVKVTLRKQWTLKDVSAAAVQAHLRLKQACSWPINYILVKQQWPTDLTKALAIEIKYFFLSYFFLSFFCSTLPDHSSFHTKPLQQHLAGGERCLAGDCAWRISLPEHPHLR